MAQHKHRKDTAADRLIGCAVALVVASSALLMSLIAVGLLIYAWLELT